MTRTRGTRTQQLVAVLSVAAVALLSGCGTRVSPSEIARGASTASADGLGDGIGDLGGGVTPEPTASATAPAGTTDQPGAEVSPGASTPSDTGSGATTDPGTTATGPANVPGISAKTIRVGVYTAQSFDAVASSLGASSNTGSQSDIAKAVAGYINKNGGIAGRQIVLSIHDLDVGLASSNVSQEYQNACASWTEDARSYAVVSLVGSTNDSLFECLQKKKLPYFSGGDSTDSEVYKRYGNVLYSPTEMSVDSFLRNVTYALSTQNYFGKAPKIGVIRIDSISEARAVQNGLKPALAKIGLKLDQDFGVSGNASQTTSDYAAAVLRFKAAGITHVFFTGLGSPLLFGTVAQQQGYHPRYVMNTRNYPQAFISNNLGPAQLANSVGIGWQPAADVTSAKDPGPISDRSRTCKKIFKDSGFATDNGIALGLAMGFCDGMFLLKDGVEKAKDYSAEGLRASVESLGNYHAAATFIGEFTPGAVHDGAKGFRMFRYVTACECYEYYTPVTRAK